MEKKLKGTAVPSTNKLNDEMFAKTSAMENILNRVTDAFVALDNNWCYTYMNKKAGEIFNRDPQKMIGKHIWTEFPEGIGQPFYKAYYKAMEEQKYIYLEEYYAPYDLWFENHIYPSAEGLSIFFRDVTARKKAEEELRMGHQRLSYHLTNSPLAVIEWDKNFIVRKWSGQAENIFEWNETEVLGKNFEELNLVFEKDTQHFAFEIDQLMKGSADRNKNVSRNNTKSGNVIYCEWYNSVLKDKNGNILSIMSLVQNITGSKLAEEIIKTNEQQLQLIYNNSIDIIFLVSVEEDKRYKFTSVNRAFLSATGLKKEDVIGKFLEEVIPEASYPLVISKYSEAIFKRETMQWEETSDYPTGRKTGIVSITPVFNENNECNMLVGTVHDITERKKSEDIIQLSHRRLKDAELIGKTGYWHWDIKTGKVSWSEGTYRIFGEVSGNFKETLEDFGRRIHLNDRERIQKMIQQVIETKVPVTYEFWIKTPDNEDKYISTTAEVILDEQGNVAALFGNTNDLTDHKKAETLLIKERDLSDSIINSLPGLFYLYSYEGKFMRWNKEFELVSGYAAQEITRMHPTDFFGPDEKDYIINRIKGVFEFGLNDAEANILTKPGEKIPFYFKAVKINYEDEPCLLGYGIDISDRKKAEEELRESEQKYKLMFDNSPLPMWMFSKTNFQIIDVNDAAIQHYGYSRNEFLEMNMKDLRPSEDVQLFLEKISLPDQQGTHLGIWRHKKKDGTLINVEIIGHDIIYKGIFARLVLGNDVTEKIIAEEKLKHSYDEIRRLASHIEYVREEEKIKISREIHDELGQQLTGLKMDISWISKKMHHDNEAVKQKIESIIELINSTINTVRKIATELHPSILDDLGLVAALQWQSQELEKRSGIKIEFSSALSYITVSKNIAVALFRIYQEALTNVLRHANATTVVATFNKEQDRFALKVSDNGIGFDTLKIENKKTLGLLSMKERALMTGGQYDIISNAGNGTTIIVSVPIN